MLRRRSSEIDLDLVAAHGHRRADRELALLRLDDVLGLPAAVRQARERRAHDPLRVRVELVHRSRDAIPPAPRAQLIDAPLGELVRGDLRAEVAAALVRVARVREEEREDLVRERQRGQDEPFLVELARVGREARGLHSAHVGVMRARDGEPERRPRDERHVGEVRAAGERVVEDPHCARLGLVRAHRGDCVGHRAEVNGDVLRLRDHPAAVVEERGRAVAALLDVRGERGADQHRAHLLRDRTEGGADHLQLDVHRRNTSVPCASVSPDQPSGIQHVAPGSSTRRGPLTL